jgi:CRP-like cAMP-binding protein
MTFATSVDRNQILSSMPASELSFFEPHLTPARLVVGDVLLRRDRDVEWVSFPLTAVVSIRGIGAPKGIEISMVGAEGLIGLSVFLGATRPFAGATVLHGGDSMRMSVDAFTAALAVCPETVALLRRFAWTQLEDFSRSAVCIARHSVLERCAREILMLDDKIESGEIDLTHLLLSEALGVRRPSVTIAAEELRARGAISYGRKHCRVTSRSTLEALSCSCYGGPNAGTAPAISA